MTMVQSRLPERYHVLEEVGQGGMAVVYRAQDATLGREVAIKVLHAHLLAEPESKARLYREAQAVAKLQHDNILQIFDYSGRDSPASFIVTEFIDGSTLKQFLAGKKLPLPEVGVLIALEVAGALAHAHGLGILHRDVKPENVMVRKDGLIKLMDFGVAQIIDLERMTVTGQLLGSPAYMAPELVEGKPVDFRTDVFSMGIMLYQLTTGALPFSGRNPHEVLKRIVECRFADPRGINRLIADRLARIIAKALARRPEDRHQSALALCDDLRDFVKDAGLGVPRQELRAFFSDPEMYEAELRPRMVVAMTSAGRRERALGKTARALELWNRALALDPDNKEVLRELRRVEGRQRARRIAIAGMSALGLGVAVFFAFRIGTREAPVATGPVAVAANPAVSPAVPKRHPIPGPKVVGATAEATRLAEVTRPAAGESYGRRSARNKDAGRGRGESNAAIGAAPAVAAASPAVAATPTGSPALPPVSARQAPPLGLEEIFTLSPTPQAVEVWVDGVSRGDFDVGRNTVALRLDRVHTIEFKPKSSCCFPATVQVGPQDRHPDNRIARQLTWKAASLTVKIDPPDPRAVITMSAPRGSGVPWQYGSNPGEEVSVPFDARDQRSKSVEVIVTVGDRIKRENVEVSAGGRFSRSIAWAN